MGFFLNNAAAYTLYRDETTKPYFVDKTPLLEELFPFIEQGSSYICITRPRRFGKTVTADMIAAFFSNACDSSSVFASLSVAASPACRKHQNQYPVIHIAFNELPRRCRNYEQYIGRIEDKLINDLTAAYPEIQVHAEDAVWDILKNIWMADSSARFLFVLDEWDYIFHRDFVTEKDKQSYLEFLNNLLKEKPYVRLAYMTGILPIAKYSSGSELNMFSEYTLATKEKFCDYFGFTDAEVDELYRRYQKLTANPRISREGLRVWYDGYQTLSGQRIYNPRSVVCALQDNQLCNYWTSSGPYDEIFYYIQNNVTDVRDDLALMISGNRVLAKVQEYAATSMRLLTRDEIFSAMVVYGFLSYEDGWVSIPNKELMDKFTDMLQKEPSLGYVYQLARASGRMLEATKNGDTDTMQEILEYAHDTEVPLLNYNNETDLAAVVNLVYLAARDFYRMEREDKAGIGYTDFIFYPDRNPAEDGIILELKADHTPEDAICQIKDRRYALRFQGQPGERPRYTGRILAVGIAYDRKTKKHRCKVEVLREKPTKE